MFSRILLIVMAAGLSAVTRAAEPEAEHAASLAAAAYREYLSGDYKAALDSVDEALRLQPDAPQALVIRGLTYIATDRLSPGLADLSRAIELAPDFHFAYTQRGWAEVRNQLNEAAIADFDAALHLQPNNPSALIGRAQARLQKQDLEGAIADANTALSTKTDFSSEDVAKAVARLQETDLLTVVRESWAHDDWNEMRPAAYLIRGKARAGSGQFEEALADLNEAARLHPADPEPLAERALVFGQIYRYQDALDDLQQACALAPDVPRYRLLAAATAQTAGDAATAATHAAAALRLQPNDAGTLLAAGLIYLGIGDMVEAEKTLTKAANEKPTPPDAWSALIQMYLGTGRPAKANELLAPAEKAGLPRDIVAFHRGQCHAATGDTEAAMQAYKDALGINPAHLEARLERKRLRFERRDYMGADLELMRALEQHPDSIELLIARAWLQLEFIDDRVAYKLADIARTKAPTHPHVLLFDAIHALNQNDWAGAIDRCSRLLRCGFRFQKDACTLRAIAYLESGDVLSAGPDLDWLGEHAPAELLTLTLDACRQVALGDLDKAIEILQRALTLQTDVDALRIDLALCQWQAGKLDDAAGTLRSTSDPDDPLTQAWLRQITQNPTNAGDDPALTIDQRLAHSKLDSFIRTLEHLCVRDLPLEEGNRDMYLPGRRYRAGNVPVDWLLMLSAARALHDGDNDKAHLRLEYVAKQTSATRVGNHLAITWLKAIRDASAH